MALRRSRQKAFKKSLRRTSLRRSSQRRDSRDFRLEALEDRRMMAVGPELVAVLVNDGTLLRDESIQNVAPRDLTFRFDDSQIIDPSTVTAIEVRRLIPGSRPEIIQPGFVGIGESPNEVVVRFAEPLDDGRYEVRIGAGGVELTNTNGDPYENVGRVRTPFQFNLNLGAQIVAVVPQPVTRMANGQLTQARDKIVVYFNDDDLHPVRVTTPSVVNFQTPTVVNPQFYQLIFTGDTVSNADEIANNRTFTPTQIVYDPATDTAELTFAQDINTLAGGAGTFRLRVGTNEPLPAAPVTVQAAIGVRSDFNTNHQVEILLTPDVTVAEGGAIAVNVTRALLQNPGDPTTPVVTVNGRTVNVQLKTADLNDPGARGTTAAELVDALNAQAGALLTAAISGGGRSTNLGSRTIDYSPLVLVDPGSRFGTATDLAGFGFSFDPDSANGRAKSIVVSSAIDKQFFPLNFPGAIDEPGHRDIANESHLATPPFFSPGNTSSGQAGTDLADQTDGATAIAYNFEDRFTTSILNQNGQLRTFDNVINEAQKQRAREVFEIYGDLLGVQFVETADQGITVATGDLAALGFTSAPGGLSGVVGVGSLTVILDNAELWSDEFGVTPGAGRLSWSEEAMESIGRLLLAMGAPQNFVFSNGFSRTFDLPPLTVQGDEPTLGVSSSGVPFDRDDNRFPGDADVIHGQHVFRPDSKDIDLYRFEINDFGRFTAETFAERSTVASHLDTVISLYRQNADGTRILVSRNDDYFSKDSFVEMDLIPGVYYVAVSASGNIDFDPENGDTGIGGKTDGKYDLRLGFRPQADASIVDIDVAGALPNAQPLDGDLDGVPGGVFDFWFQAGPTIFVDKAKPEPTLSAAINNLTNPVTITVDSVQGLPAAPFTIRIDQEQLRVTAVDVANRRLTATRAVNGTFPASHAAGARVTVIGNGSLSNPFGTIPEALAAVTASTKIIRLVGDDTPAATPEEMEARPAYVIGRNPVSGQPLADGVDLEVPRGVTLMIDEGAVFKMRRSNIVVGSSLPTIDRSAGAIQVLGVPGNNVIFTSYDDETLGRDTNTNLPQTPNAGDWGGIVIRNDVDRASNADRLDYERQGIFLNYINQADFRYGGGLVTLGSVEQSVAPIFLIDARPTVTFNTITRSAGAAMSANPDSFEESNFHDPQSQRLAAQPGTGDRPFTLDYRRVGPHIRGNVLRVEEPDPDDGSLTVVHDNSLNGLFIRLGTPASNQTEKLTVAGRFDDADIVHILQENLEIQATPGGLTVERYISAPAPIPLTRLAGGTLAAGSYNYFVTFVDADGVEGPRSEISNTTVLAAGSGRGTIRVSVQSPAVGEFVRWRLYRSAETGTGPYVLVTEQAVGVSVYDDTGATLGGSYNGAASEPIIETTLGGGSLPDGTFNYLVTFVDENGIEGPASPLSENVTIVPGGSNRTVRLTIARPPLGEFLSWRLYRSQPTGRGPYVQVTEQDAAVFSFDDRGFSNGLEFRGSFVTVERGRLDARLKVDPSVVIKSEGARIEAARGGQIIAEGRDGQEVVFTSLRDVRYGAGGTFVTAQQAGAAAPGDWGGVYVGHTASASFDHAILAYGGGVTRVEGGFGNFNVLEIHQAQARIANSLFEFNGDGTRQLDPVDDPDRVGRGRNAPGVIFIRAAQPVVINNVIKDSAVTAATLVPGITINVNSLNADLVTDWGRTTGEIDRFTQMLDNQGPLFRGNVLEGPPGEIGPINGLLVRGNALTTEGVWDDTDIVHVVLNEVLVPDFHTKGGLRLESSRTESLVVKLFGADAGFTATGLPLDIDDRIGGSLHIVGQPGHPVVLTSLRDCTVGAGLTLDGRPQIDTSNGLCTAGLPPSVVNGPMIDQFSDTAPNIDEWHMIADATGTISVEVFENDFGTIAIDGQNPVVTSAGQTVTISLTGVAPGSQHVFTHEHSGALSHYRPRFIGVSQAFLREDQRSPNDLFNGPGGSGTNEGSNLELGFDARFDTLPAAFADTTWFYDLDAGDNFTWNGFFDVFPGGAEPAAIELLDPSGAVVATAQGPNFFANGTTFNVTVAAGQEGFWGVHLTAPQVIAPFAGHYLMDVEVTNNGVRDPIKSERHYLLPSSFLDPGLTAAGDWRGIRLLQNANDRNVEIVTEREANNEDAPGLNATPENAQFLGELAPNELSGDDVRRLGFEVHGFLNGRIDVDTYSFRARTGTEVWLDIDNTTHALDTIVELIDANGVVIARSDNSLDESAEENLIFRNNQRIAERNVNAMVKSAFEIDDHFSTNPRDAGMRIVLPGSAGAVGTYHVRLRSANPGVAIPNDQLLDGRSMGRYEMQIRLREMDEVPGSTVQYANIHFASTAIDIQGLPRHSPLVGETAESNAPNHTRANAQEIGNLLASDRGAISVAGFLNAAGATQEPDPVNPNVPNQPNPADPDDVDWYTFTIQHESVQFPAVTDQGSGVIFDLDFADNLGRPDIRLSVFDEQGRLVFSSDDASVADDISAPNGVAGARDVNRGSSGPRDAFIGPVQLPAGRYYVAVSHAGDVPAELAGVTSAATSSSLARVEPLDSIVRIAEDHLSLGFGSTSTVQPQQPITPLFVDQNGNFVGTRTPFTLSDVTLFVNQLTGSSESTVHMVDAFSGDIEATAGAYPFASGDFALRPDGRLFGYSVDLQGADAPMDADSGIFYEINPATGAAVVLQDDGIQTFEPDAMGAPVRTHVFNNNRIGHGIQFQATAYNRNASRLIAIGNRGGLYPFDTNFYLPGANYDRNILFRMDPSDFDGDTNAPGLPDEGARNPPLGGSGTNFLDRGPIATAVDMFGGGRSVLVAPNATAATGNPFAGAIRDGAFFDVQVDNGSGVVTTLGRFEMNSGPEAIIDFDLNNNEFFLDGEFFTLDGEKFEFNTGAVLVPNGFSPGQLTEGAQIVIDDNSPTPVRRVFEVTTDPVVQAGAVPLLVTGQTTEAQFVGIFINAVNNQFQTTTWNVQAFLSNGRVTLTGDAPDRNPILRNGNTGFNISGGFNLIDPNATAIRIEENFQPGQVTQAILNVMNGTPGNPPGVPGIESGAQNTRINFLGAVVGDFDSSDNNPTAPRTPRFMTAVPNTNGNVAVGNIEVPFLADDTGEEIAEKIIAAVNSAMITGLTATGTTPPSRTVTFVVSPLVFGPNAEAVVTLPSGSPFGRGGQAPGGVVTGAAFVGNELFVVSDAGGLYRVPNIDSGPVLFGGSLFHPTDYINSAIELVGIRFAGLTAGPPNLQGGAFADLLFGITDTGRIYAFNTDGVLQPIFQDGAAFIETGIFNANGLQFSTLDYNLWHRTTRDPVAGDDYRFDDLGHGLEPDPTRSRIGPRTNSASSQIGGSSLYFGNRLRDVANTAQGRSIQSIDADLDGTIDATSLGQAPGTRKTYDFPGGAHGSIQSAPFSLEGYAADDQPTLYFNYFLETEDANGVNMRDSFRVFASADDPALPSDPTFAADLIQGQWYLLATNNVAPNNQGILVPQDGPSPFSVQQLHDQPATGGSWRQARIDLSPFAGQKNIRLRFDFASGGSMDAPHFNAPGLNDRFNTATWGEELRIIPGADLRDGQTFTIDNTLFEFDLGVTLVAPTGDALADAETFTINDGAGLPVNFEFHNDNTFRRNIRAQNGSFFRDGDTFTLTDAAGRTQAFEFESGYTIIVPQVGVGVGGIQDGDTFTIDDGLGTSTSVVTFEFDTDGDTDPDHIPVNVNVDQAILIPAAGGGFGGVTDGATFRITDQNGVVFVFEFDNNGSIGQTGGRPHVPVLFTATSTQADVANAVAAAINNQTMTPDVTAVALGGEVRLGTLAVTVDTTGAVALGTRFIAGDRLQIADAIVFAIEGSNQGLTPLHTRRGGAFTGEVHVGGTSHVLNTQGTPALRQRGEPGLTDPEAVAVPFLPDESLGAGQVATLIAQAINTAAQQGEIGVTATVSGAVVILNPTVGTDFGFSPGSTALRPEGIIPIAFTNSQSAEEVAAAMAAAIAGSTLNVTAHVVGHRINLEAGNPANALLVTQSPGTGSATPGVVREGASGALQGEPVRIHSEMTFQQVRDEVARVLNATFAPGAADPAHNVNVFTTYDNVVRIQGHTITNAGPLGATSLATAVPAPFRAALAGDQLGALNNSDPAERGLDNRHEGVYIDDIIIGFAERGEMITGASTDDTFVHTGLNGTVGAYQLEIRRASEYGTWLEAPGTANDFLALQRAFDTNDRLSQDFTLFAPAGSQIGPTATFTISDGVETIMFEYVNRAVPGAQPRPGNVPVFFSPGDSAATVAKSIRDTINSQLVQQNLSLNVSAASLPTSDRVDLVGETVIVNIIKPGLTIDEVTTEANDLRDALLGPGVTPIGDARFVGGPFSAGQFSGGTSSIGIERGIVLSSGDVRFAEGPNANDGASGDAAQLGDADLDDEFGVVTEDTTILQFDFELDAADASDLFFNFVFASEEYNEFVNTGFNDVFAFFVDGRNIAFVPGTTDPISINTINGGNPFGTASKNPQFYNNNDPNEGGQFLNRFGLDGFTQVFTAVATDLAPGVHTIKLAISDVGDRILDSAVFIEAGSFSAQPPAEPIRNGITGIQHNEIGDTNRRRDQGQVVIANNQIFNSATFGIVVDSAPRDPANGNAPAPGAVRNLEELNNERLTPGVVIMNNVVAHSGEGGLRFSGDPGGAGLPPGAVPFGRIVNNTFYGAGANDVGILIEENAGPTLMNNIVANFAEGVRVDASSQPNTVIASTLYQGNGSNSNVGLGTNFPVVLPPNAPLFVDPANNNFNLEAGSQAIDSSIDSLQERPTLRNVKDSLNIPPSNVLSPERDALGQLRRDDPTFSPPFGAGQVVFKDRGALDRVDFEGPTAVLIAPQDNDVEGLDLNRSLFDVKASGQVIPRFQIKLVDGVAPIDPSQGVGVDPSTVTPETVVVEYFLPEDVGLNDPEILERDIDYTFHYNPLDDVITLQDVGGQFPAGFYRITLDNTALDPDNPDPLDTDGIRDLAGNLLKPNRPTGETSFLIEIPDDLDFGDAPESYGTLLDPLNPNSIVDGARHTITPNFFLGTAVDAELDGQPSQNADGDGADEDGVRFNGQTLAGATVNIGTVTLDVFASMPGFLDAWIDANRDGVFDDAEKAADSVPLNSANNSIAVTIGAGALEGPTYARFRFSDTGGLGPTGPGGAGEVEDYLITLRATSPWQNPNNGQDVNGDGLVSIIDAVLVVSDLRENNARPGNEGTNVHRLFETPAEAEAENQVWVAPGRPPFVDVSGDRQVTVSGDLLPIITTLRNRLSGNGEPEGESPSVLAAASNALTAEGEAPDLAAGDQTAQPAASLHGIDLSSGQRGAESTVREAEQPNSLRSARLGNELLLANSSFRTFEFESALADIAEDVDSAWAEDVSELGDLEDYFPYGDVAQSRREK